MIQQFWPTLTLDMNHRLFSAVLIAWRGSRQPWQLNESVHLQQRIYCAHLQHVIGCFTLPNQLLKMLKVEGNAATTKATQ